MSAPAKAPSVGAWALDDLLTEIVGRVVADGLTVSQVVDEMWPITLRPEDRNRALREAIIRMANDGAGMRGFRSGHIQSARSGPRPVDEETAGLDEYAECILSRLVYEAADGSMRSVLDFTVEDAQHAYDVRVRAVRERADREEPFWRALMQETTKAPLRERSERARSKLAVLAVSAKLTNDE